MLTISNKYQAMKKIVLNLLFLSLTAISTIFMYKTIVYPITRDNQDKSIICYIIKRPEP